MSLTNLLKKASSLLGLSSPDSSQTPPLDGEIIYCKNNVCVHPPAALTTEAEHYPGYLNIRSQDDEVLGSTLILTWIPNSTLQRNPRSIENSPRQHRVSPRRSPRQEYSKTNESSSVNTPTEQGEETDDRRDSFMSYDEGRDKIFKREGLVESYKSQASDSGISQDLPASEGQCSSFSDNTRMPHITSGQVNVKQSSPADSAGSGGSDMSSDSDSPSSDAQLRALLLRNKLYNPAVKGHIEECRRRTSSNKSVTSIEMEGDNLIVVTEEIDESPFTDDHKDATQSSQDRRQENGSPGKHSQSNGGDVTLDFSAPLCSVNCHNKITDEFSNEMQQLNTTENGVVSQSKQPDIEKLKESLDLKLTLQNNPTCEDKVITPDISVTEYDKSKSVSSSLSSTPTSGPDSRPPSPITPPQYYTPISTPGQHYLASSEESLTASHNLSFPANSVIYTNELADGKGGGHKTAKEQLCGVFSVDLGQMRSLRIFYTNEACTSGQLVIASRESQYKILNFHHGGLDRLADTLSQWKFLAQPKQEKRSSLSETKCRQFSVIRPYLSGDQCHPEEGAYEMVTDETWKQHMNESGLIEDDFHLRRAIFFAGLESSLRQEMWPFLLHYYPYNSTFEERERIRNDRYIIYQNIRKKRELMSPEEQTLFWKTTQCIVEKDVVRTDRSHPYFKGENNPNLEVLKNILLNYAVAHPCYGYTQGMSDLLAPVLVEIQNEVDAYWCFLGLMQRTIFVSSPKDVDMDKQLGYLRELLRLMLPHFYEHMLKVQDGLELLFCHRWILLCFKREFPETDALTMWEACWAHYQTDYFHLFICVAIIAVYGEDVVQQDLPADEMLLHFSSLSMHMSGPVVLSKARGLLHQFRIMTKIPCTLEGICTLCGSGMWDSGHVPSIECVGNHPDSDVLCPYQENDSAESP